VNARIGPAGGEAMSCADARDLAADLALGTLAGDDRARLLEHIDVCPGCEALVADLAGVVDSLLLLTPEADPPPGFESAVLARIAGAEAGQVIRRAAGRSGAVRWPRARTLVAAVAAAVVLVTGSVAGTVALRGGGTRPAAAVLLRPGQLRTAALVGTNGYAWGQAFLFSGKTSWVFVDMKWDVPNGAYTVMLDRWDGASMALAGLHLTDGEGSWGHTVGGAMDVTAVRVVDAGGHTICRADMRPEQV